jgi:hypothetical protein
MNPITNPSSRHFQGATYTYTELGLLGAGQTATVYRVRQEGTGQEYALKLLSAEEYHTRFFREVDTLALLSRYTNDLTNPDGRLLVPRIIEHKETGADQFIVMTLAFGRPLDEIQREQGRLPEREALTILAAVAQLFHILHTQLHRSYLDFQPRNIYWEAKSRSLLVLDWNLLSPEGQADVATDIGALGALLYRLVVGVQPPAYGLSAAPEWSQVTPATQAILRKATHGDPTLRYASAQALGEACASQLHWWNEPAADLLRTVEDQSKGSAAALAYSGTKQPGDESIASIVATRNLMGILELRRKEMGKSFEALLDNLKAELQPIFDRYGSVLEQGIAFLAIPDRTGAAERFRQAMRETSDPQEQLTAARWLLVAEIENDAARKEALAACQELVANQPERALAKLSERMAEQGKGSAQTLRRDAQAQILWKQAEERQRRAAQSGKLQDLNQALAALTELIQTLDGLPEDHRTLLAHRWGDITQTAATLRSRVEALQTKESQLSQLRNQIQNLPPTELLTHLQGQFELSPRSPELVAIALDAAQDQILNLRPLKMPEAVLTRIDPIQKLLSLALTEGFDGPLRSAIQAEWEISAALRQLGNLLGTRYLHVPQMKEMFAQVSNSTSQDTRNDTLALMAEMVMAQAQEQDSLEMADEAVRLAQAYAATTASSLVGQRNAMAKEHTARGEARQKQEADYWANIEETIRLSRQSGSLTDNDKARALLSQAAKLVREEDRQRRARVGQLQTELTEELRTLQQADIRRQDAEAVRVTFGELQSRLRGAATANDAYEIADELVKLANNARQQKLLDLAGEIDLAQKQTTKVAQHLSAEAGILVQARKEYDAYASSPGDDPDYRTVRLAKLRKARGRLAPLATQKEEVHSPEFVDLWASVDSAWQTEGGESDPANPTNPLIDRIDALTNRVETALVARTQTGRPQPTKTPGWLAWIPLATLVILLALLAVFLMRVTTLWTAVEATSDTATSLMRIESALDKLSTNLADLTGSDQVIIMTALPPIQTGVAQMATDITTLKNAVPENAPGVENGQVDVIPNATEVFLQQLSQSLAGTAAAIAVTQTTIAAEHAAAETNLLATQTAMTAKAAAIQATGTAVFATSVAVDAKQTQVSTQSKISTQTLEQARTTATALIQNAAAEATAIADAAAAAQSTAAALVATPTPIPMQTPTLTPTLTPIAAVGRFVISFPQEENANLYVAPWQVEVTVTEWLAPETQYRLLLDGVELITFTVPVTTPLTHIVYERAFVDGALFDGFPGVDDTEAVNLKLNANRQLPAGPHTFTLQAQVEETWGDVARQTFTIRGDTPPQGTRNTQTNLQRRMGPNQTAQADSLSGLPAGYSQPVRLLGRTAGFYQDPTVAGSTRGPVDWVLWETTDNNPRRGWAPAQFFTFLDGATIDDVPEIAPAQSN